MWGGGGGAGVCLWLSVFIASGSVQGGNNGLSSTFVAANAALASVFFCLYAHETATPAKGTITLLSSS